MAASDEEEVLATVNGFFASISNNKPPFPDALGYTIPGSYAVLSHQEELTQCSLGELVPRIEDHLTKLYNTANGATTSVRVTAPGPDVWVANRFAAVWAGYSSSINGEEKLCGVNAITLFKLHDGWKIGGIADTQWKADEEAPALLNDATPEMMAPILELVDLLNEKKWDEVMRVMLPGGGATYSRYPETLLTPLWPEFFTKMKAMLEKSSGYVEQKLMDWEGRIMGDLGFVWTPFTVTVDGDLKVVGYNIFTMLKREGKWLISGCQDG